MKRNRTGRLGSEAVALSSSALAQDHGSCLNGNDEGARFKQRRNVPSFAEER